MEDIAPLTAETSRLLFGSHNADFPDTPKPLNL